MRPFFKSHLHLRLLAEDRLLLGEGQMAKNILLDGVISDFLAALDGSTTPEQIHSRLLLRHPTLLFSEVQASLDKLVAANLVDDADRPRPTDFTDEELERYSRQLSFFGMSATSKDDEFDFQRKLREAHVTVLGCGGVGSHTLLNLAAVGVGRIRVVEFDKVETSNLNRSFIFRDTDIGRKKLDVLAPALESLNPRAQYEWIDTRVEEPEQMESILQGTDFALLAADTPYLRINDWFNHTCLALRVPYSLAGCSQIDGTVGPMTIPFQTSCFSCQSYDRTDLFSGPDYVVEANKQRRAPSFAPIISSLASINAGEVVKYLTGWATPSILNRKLAVNFATLKFEFKDAPRRPDCVECGGAFDDRAGGPVAC